jgi:uncharacterized surface protein with fasciclin (FAS1) repeats
MKNAFAVVAAGLMALALVSTGAAAQMAPQNDSQPVSQTGTDDIVDTAVAAGDFTTLATALEAAGLVDTLKGEGPFTVFAPTDAAFAALPEGTVEALLADIPALTDILLYHVVSGSVPAADVVTLDAATTIQGSDVSIEVVDGGVVLNDSVNVVTTDVFASNGVIHVIDAVLLPPTPADMDAPEADIVDTAVAAGDFTTLATALEAAGLVDTLKGEGPFTVFAPTDAAFAALPAGTVEGLLADIPALTDVLTYHVVAGEVLAADVVGLSSATTVQGSEISIEVVDGSVILNGNVEVVATDVLASNGVIHVIDGVLLPPADDTVVAPDPGAAGNAGLGDSGISTAWFAALGALAVIGLLGVARFATSSRRS